MSLTPPSGAAHHLGFRWVADLVRSVVERTADEDPNPGDPFRGLYITDEHASELAAEGLVAVSDGRLALAADRLVLDDIDTAILSVAAAPEVTPGYGRLYGYLHDDVTRKLPSAGLIARLLGEEFEAAAVLTRLAHDGRLRRVGALRMVDERGDIPLQDRPIRVAEALAGFLIGASLGPRMAAGRFRRLVPDGCPLGRRDTVAEIRRYLSTGDGAPIVIHGPDAPELLTDAVDAPALVLHVSGVLDAETRREAVLIAALDECVLAIEGLEDVPPDERSALAHALDDLPGRLLICAASATALSALSGRTTIVLPVPPPSFDERRAAFAALSGIDDVERTAATYRLSIAQIATACGLAADAALADGREVTAAHLDDGARRASGAALGELATRVRLSYTWDQLILPEQQRAMLRSVFAFLRHRDLVLSQWGYERALAQNQGIKVLFAGDSGTGKTMAAQVVARELGLDMFRVDLATVVSKYIGETEKNLDRIFLAAEGSNAMLFFDEADALFGRRSEVGDAHDRYANLETAYLLQRMEGYPGAVILATNFRHNIDEAFLRRLDVVIDFPFPDAEDRERIWRVALPGDAPLADDLDLAFLATRFKLSGGGIRNASLAGAFLAADDGGVIGMRHLVQGVANEYAKLGRLTMESDFERFHDLVTGNGQRAGDHAASGTGVGA